MEHGGGLDDRFTAIADAWRTRYGFTEAETGVFLALLAGIPRVTLAAKEGIRLDTVKRHARHIKQKTGDAHLADALLRAMREEIEKQSTEHSP